MKKQEQRIAIAEACGWEKKRYLFESITIDDCEQWITSWFKNGTEFFPNHLPDYLNDLNAMHEAVESLNRQNKHDYAVILATMFWEIGWLDWRNTLDVSEATAAQRAEAFLKAIGKWKKPKARQWITSAYRANNERMHDEHGKEISNHIVLSEISFRLLVDGEHEDLIVTFYDEGTFLVLPQQKLNKSDLEELHRKANEAFKRPFKIPVLLK